MTRTPKPKWKPGMLALARSVQNSYPQIYLACHVDHVRRRGNDSRLTSGDSSILAHLSFHATATPSQLAKHLGVAASSVSARIKYLQAGGYIARGGEMSDRRVVRLELTEKGAAASSAASVLDTERVIEVLAALPEADRSVAVDGLAVLARAAAVTMRKH